MDEDLQKEYVKIYHTSMSVEEFKQKWLDLQAKHEARFSKAKKIFSKKCKLHKNKK
ncbi:hypothetical protein H2277_00700 [Campylobacter sp. W0014]|uniref:hypothetical protein n=1 Tax=Campylobacter sp. W0014 TaxID=2735781 RepID=UPI001EB9702D|nr:hypothetical protein [Campylobacter sp. W0014]